MVTLEIAQDRLGSPVTTVHRLDHKGSAGNAISGSKDARAGGCKGVRIDGDGFAGGEADPGITGDKSQTSTLPD